jgi:sulfite exporter TauE/SafE
MFVTGLVTSVHCVAMCGSMVLTYAVTGENEGSAARRMLPHLAYQGAKIVSYVLVGLALGAVGSVLNLGGVRGWVTFGAGLFMILLGLSLTGRFPALRRLSPRPPRFLMDALSTVRRKAKTDAATGHASLATPIAFGLLTGLMPCAPLQAAQLAAAATGSPVLGALAMLAFGLGTMPLMLGFGAASGALSRGFRDRMMAVLAIVVIVFGVVMLNRGAMLVGSPVTFASARAAIVGERSVPSVPPATAAALPRAAGGAAAPSGVAEIRLVIQNTAFVPDTLSIPAGRPVRLLVDRREAAACSDQIAIPQLGVLKDLAPNTVTVVDLPATKAGSYTLTCGMGMMSGRITAVPSASSATVTP